MRLRSVSSYEQRGLLSAGQAIQEAEVRVVEPETLEEEPIGEAGELWFRRYRAIRRARCSSVSCGSRSGIAANEQSDASHGTPIACGRDATIHRCAPPTSSSADPRAVPPEEIADLEVRATFLAGRQVYRKDFWRARGHGTLQSMSDLADPRFLDERLAHWAETKPDEEAVTYLGRTWTWAQWNDRVRRLAGALTALGVKRGDVVAFLDKNHPACLEMTFAAASLGAANAIINFRLAADEMDYVLNDSGARVLFVGAELKPSIDKIREKLPNVEKVIEVTPDGGDGDEYEALLAGATPVDRSSDVDPDDVCIIMYSSGTTGRPKGVALTQANLIAHTVNGQEGFEFDDGDKNMVAMPLFHVGGTSYAQLGIHNGIPSVMTRDVDGAALAGAILQGANRTFLVPAVLAKVLDSGPDAVKLFGALKTYSYGASPMPLPLLRAALEAWPNTDFIQAYGLTELCGVISHLMPEDHRAQDHEERLSSAGTLVPNAEVRVVDPDTLEGCASG